MPCKLLCPCVNSRRILAGRFPLSHPFCNTWSPRRLQLLKQGIRQSCIKWVVPHDEWYFVLDKMYENNSPIGFQIALVEVMLQQTSVQGIYEELEARGVAVRLNQNIVPDACHCIPIMMDELRSLRTVEMVRLGGIKAVRAESLELQLGQIKLEPDTLLVDCTADGVDGYHGSYQIFSPQHIRLSVSLSALNAGHASSCIAYLESKMMDDAEKNSICDAAAMSYPTRFTGDLTNFIDILYADLKTQRAFARDIKSAKFLLDARTNPVSPTHCSLKSTMWTLFGPKRLNSKLDKFIAKVESVGYDGHPPKKALR